VKTVVPAEAVPVTLWLVTHCSDEPEPPSSVDDEPPDVWDTVHVEPKSTGSPTAVVVNW
jgi:hypothetical protein